jgi:hypothetical protein
MFIALFAKIMDNVKFTYVYYDCQSFQYEYTSFCHKTIEFDNCN